MGLASALSYYVVMIVALVYLLSKKSVFRFSRKAVKMRTIRELFVSGTPAGFNMLASVILVFAMNRLLTAMPAGGETSAAYR